MIIPRLALIVFATLCVLPSQGAWAEKDSFTDLAHILMALNAALETSPSGTKTKWENPSTGHHGVIIPSPAFKTSTGEICRDFERTWVLAGGRVATYQGTACRQANGVWKIREEAQVPQTSIARAPELSDKRSQPTSGEKRDLTANVQRLLNKLGYEAGPEDGIVGPKSSAAIRVFQRQVGLPVDGQVSQRLLKNLEEAVAAATAQGTPALASPMPRAPPGVTGTAPGISRRGAPSTEPRVAAPPPIVPTVAARHPQRSSRELLIKALDDLTWATAAKIDADVGTVARAFWHARDFEHRRRPAGSILAPLALIEQAVSRAKSAKDAETIARLLSSADSPLELSSILASLSLRHQAIEKAPASADQAVHVLRARTMLEVAGQYDAEEDFSVTIRMYLLGFGNLESPVGLPDLVTARERATRQWLWGGVPCPLPTPRASGRLADQSESTFYIYCQSGTSSYRDRTKRSHNCVRRCWRLFRAARDLDRSALVQKRPDHRPRSHVRGLRSSANLGSYRVFPRV